jgi:lipopolysaccharide biosynthesis glycosyltransferase
MLDVLKEKQPAFSKYAQEYLEDYHTYLNNMYVMKKEIFNDYCEWLFDILDECDKRINYTNYSTEAIRTVGHLAERLLNIYILYLVDTNKYRIKELPTVYFMNTSPKENIEPAFTKNNIPIALAANDFYAPYLATTITSIVSNSSQDNNYDILIMQRDISDDNKRRLLNIVKNKNNCSLRFIDVSAYSEKFSKLFTHMHFTIETWYRLVMPEILNNYDKVIYLDSDLVVDADIAKLFSADLKDNLLAATKDADTAGLYNGYDPERKEYMDNILKIKKPYEYFQAGVIVFNLKQFRKEFNVADTLKYASSYKWKLLDQDVLNNLTQGRVEFIDMSWNVMTDWASVRVKDIISRAPKELSDAYMEARNKPNIIHYAGGDKPWQKPDMDLSEYFWKYAKESGYYEIILSRLIPASEKSIKEKIKNASKKALPAGSKRGEFLRKIVSRSK